MHRVGTLIDGFSYQCGDCGDCACQMTTNDEYGAPAMPTIYALELTPACNNRCPGCGNVFTSRTPPVAPLSAARWEDLLDIIEPHARKLKVTGGEPTLHPDFADIVRAIAARDIPFTLFTNARWPNPAEVLALLQEIPQCVGLLVSLHGPDAQSHEVFSGVPGSFAEAVGNIRQAVDAGLTVATSTVITQHNVNRVEETVALSQSLDAGHAVFNRYLGAPLPAIEPSREQLRSAIRSIESMIHRGDPVRYGNPIPQCFAFNSSHGCVAGKAYCTLDPWGTMRPCNHSPTKIGNLFEQPLEALWHSEAMEAWRALTPSECQGCPDRAVCGGGCKAMAELRAEHGDPLNVKHARTASSPGFDPELPLQILATRGNTST
jgi:radical SAM protein with 4Fe4S-binding SPASM domain